MSSSSTWPRRVREQPENAAFNGRVGALMGENALRMKAGESVRLYLGNAGPALMSSFHIVGEIFDDVYGEGGTKVNQNNVQTTVVPVGGAAMVDLEMDVPGNYQFVDHSMFRAFNKGAMGAMEVETDAAGNFLGPAGRADFQSRNAPATHRSGEQHPRPNTANRSTTESAPPAISPMDEECRESTRPSRSRIF